MTKTDGYLMEIEYNWDRTGARLVTFISKVRGVLAYLGTEFNADYWIEQFTLMCCVLPRTSTAGLHDISLTIWDDCQSEAQSRIEALDGASETLWADGSVGAALCA